MLKLFSDCYTDRRLYAGCGITVPHESLARYYRQHLRIQFADIDLHFTVGTVRNNVQKVGATLLCRAYWKQPVCVAVSYPGTTNILRNKRKSNPTAVPLFSQRSPVSGLRQTMTGNG